MLTPPSLAYTIFIQINDPTLPQNIRFTRIKNHPTSTPLPARHIERSLAQIKAPDLHDLDLSDAHRTIIHSNAGGFWYFMARIVPADGYARAFSSPESRAKRQADWVWLTIWRTKSRSGSGGRLKMFREDRGVSAISLSRPPTTT